MKPEQTIAKNFLSLTLANIASKLIGMGSAVYLGRILGPVGFGEINMAGAITGYFAMLSHFGLNVTGAREISQDRKSLFTCINNVLSLKLCMGAAAFLLLSAFAFSMNRAGNLFFLTLFYGMTIFTANVFPFDWVFQGLEKMEHQAMALIAQSLIYFSLTLALVSGSGQIIRMPFILFTAQAVSAWLLFRSFKITYPEFKFNFSLTRYAALLRQAAPVGISGVMGIIILNTGLTLLGFMKSAEEAGYYSAAQRVALLFMEAFIVYVVAVFPTMSRYYAQDKAKMGAILNYTLKILYVAALPALFGMVAVAEPTIRFLYGHEFGEAVAPLQILMFYALLTGLNSLFINTLWAAHKQRRVLQISAVNAVMTVVFSYLFISRFGAAGAAGAGALAGGISTLIYRHAVSDLIPLHDLKHSLKPLLAAAAMSIVLFLLKGLNLFILIGVGILVYTIVIFAIKGLTREDIRSLHGLYPLGKDTTAA